MVALPQVDNLSYGTAFGESYRVRRVQFGDGFSQRSKDGLNTEVQSWSLIWENIDNADAEALRLFFRGLGGSGIIDWQPYEQPDVLRFTANDFQCQPTGPKAMTVNVTLTQEFDL